MQSFSVRLDAESLAALRAYAAARRLKPSTALRRLALDGLKRASTPPVPKPTAPAIEHALLAQCRDLLQLLCLYQLQQFQLSFLEAAPVNSYVRRFHEAQALANQTFDRNPDLFGPVRFPLPDAPAKPVPKTPA